MAKITFNPFEYLRDKKDLSDGGEPVEKKIEQQPAALISEREIEIRRYVQTEFPKIFKECYDRFSNEIDYVYEPVGKVDYKGENLNTFEYIERLVREHYNVPFQINRFLDLHTSALFYTKPIDFGFTHHGQNEVDIPRSIIQKEVDEYGVSMRMSLFRRRYDHGAVSSLSSRIVKSKIKESVSLQKEYIRYQFETYIKRFFLYGRCEWTWIQIDQLKAFGFNRFPNCQREQNSQLVYSIQKRKEWGELDKAKPNYPIHSIWNELNQKCEEELTLEDHLRWTLASRTAYQEYYSQFQVVGEIKTEKKYLTVYHPKFGEVPTVEIDLGGLSRLKDSGYDNVFFDYLSGGGADPLNPYYLFRFIKLELDDVIDDPARIAAILETYQEPENRLREKFGLPKIGEGWISETNLYYEIKEAFPQVSVIHHGKPKWLGKQHLDIWIPEYNIGIEYQGDQHFFPVDFFGGKQALKNNKERDARKKALCEQNQCKLIYVLPGYELEEVISEVGGLL